MDDGSAGPATGSQQYVSQESERRRTFIGLVAIGSIATTGVLYILVYWWGLQGASNFRNEVWPAYLALIHGHIAEFLRLGPQYVGSLILRAPFALLAAALGGGVRATYFATALPCLLAAPVLGAWLSLRARRRTGTGFLSRISPIVFFAFNPIVVMALIIGHPEDVLGAVLCVAAVVLALDGAGLWAGLLIGIAVANKAWALVAVPVVLVALTRERRRAVVMVALSAGIILLPAFLARQHGVSASGAASSFGSKVSTIFLKPELLWWFGPHAWIVREAHVAIVVVCVLAAGIWWLIRGRYQPRQKEDEVFLLLTMVMLLRASLDPWDNVYYHVPFVFALMAYEARRAPWLTVTYSCLLIVVIPPFFLHNAELNAGAYTAVAGSTLLVLASRLFLPERFQIPRLRRSLWMAKTRAGARAPELTS
jgi:hypothetical protein